MMISDETMLQVTQELEGLDEEQFINEVCSLFVFLMVMGGVSDCAYGVPKHGAVLNYNSGTMLEAVKDIQVTYH